MSKQIRNKDTLKLNSNRYLTRAKYFDLGSWKEQSQNQLNESFGSNKNILNSVGSIGSGITSIIDSGMKNAQVADTSNIRNSINTFANTPIESSSREALSNQWINTQLLKNDYTRKDFRTSNRERIGNTFNAVSSGATTGLQIGGPWGALIGGVVGLGSAIGGMVSGNIKAGREAYDLNELATRENINNLKNNYYMANYLDDYDAYNFRRLSALGGYLGQTHGANWSNNVTHINEGGFHSENKYEGVQVGVDQEGVPDLVEEGEVIFNDYVFSNRLSPTKEQLKEALLPDKYADHTFAWIAKELSRESEERANDAISINGLNDSMNKLIQVHELVRQENEAQESNRFDFGGDMRKIYGLNKNEYDDIKDKARVKLVKSGIEEDPSNHEWNKSLEKEIELLAIHFAAERYASSNSGAEKDSPRYNEVYDEYFNRLSNNRVERLNKEEAIRQADQFRKDRGYPELKPTRQTGWSYGTYNQNRNFGMSDEDYKIWDDIRSRKRSYIDGELSAPSQTNRIIDGNNPSTEEKTDNPQDAPITMQDIQNYFAQYLQRSFGNYGYGFGYPQQRRQTENNDISNIPVPELPEIPDVTDEEINEIIRKTDESMLTEEERFKKMGIDYNPFGSLDSTIHVDKLPLPENGKFDYETLLKYAPILGNAISLLGNRKDYSDVNSFMEQTVNPRSVRFTPLGNYIRPEYVSPWELTNPIERQASATRNAIMDNSGNNRAAASAALVGSDYNTLGLLGQAYLQGKQYNNQQRLQAADFNRGTDQYNSQGSLQAQTANMSLNDYYLNRALQEYNMRNMIDMSYNQARSANSTALTQNLFNLYKDKYIKNQANSNRYLRYADNGDGTSYRK